MIDAARFAAVLRDRGSKFGVGYSESELDQLFRYYDLLRSWNKRVNLTALPLDEVEFATVDRLFVEPGIAADLIPVERLRLLDLGSGGGSPAIPLKVLRPLAALTMVESRGKKAAFLREACRVIGVAADVLECRFEELSLEPASADVISVRAVRLDENLVALIKRWLTRNGRLLFFAASAAPAVESMSFEGSAQLPGHEGATVQLFRNL